MDTSQNSEKSFEPTVVDAILRHKIDRLLHLARATRNTRICCSGEHSLAVLIALCRSGYDNVECATQATCNGADDRRDLLLLLPPTDDAGLTTLLHRTVPLLREGGVLAMQLSSIDQDRSVELHLASMGWEIDSTVFDLSGAVLVAHTIRPALALAKAC